MHLRELPESCARNCTLPLYYPVSHVGNVIRMSGSALFQSPSELRFPEFAYEMALTEYFSPIKEQQPNLDKDIKDILSTYKNSAIPLHNRIFFELRPPLLKCKRLNAVADDEELFDTPSLSDPLEPFSPLSTSLTPLTCAFNTFAFDCAMVGGFENVDSAELVAFMV
uniref:Uncharacterized protein n=1 Tax=Glossina palpalis gambiensis TaxID=67801 RepID=A0A1B0BKG3_9MUSC